MTPYQNAILELGQKEVAGNQHNERILEYHSTTTLKATADEVSWCSSFVNWCMIKGGVKGTNSAAARSWLRWGVPTATPEEGDVVIFRRGNPPSGHVGFFVAKDKDWFTVLGGKQSDSVKYSKYKVADVLGYRKIPD